MYNLSKFSILCISPFKIVKSHKFVKTSLPYQVSDLHFLYVINKTTETGSSENIRARRHYTSANVDGTEFELYNDAYVKVSLCYQTK